MNIIRDMVVKTYTNKITGKLTSGWQMKQIVQRTSTLQTIADDNKSTGKLEYIRNDTTS